MRQLAFSCHLSCGILGAVNRSRTPPQRTRLQQYVTEMVERGRREDLDSMQDLVQLRRKAIGRQET